jgi:hypothetical protein
MIVTSTTSQNFIIKKSPESDLVFELGLDALEFEKNVAKQDLKGLEIGKTGLKPVSKQQHPKEFTVPKPRSGLKFGKYLNTTIWTSLEILQNQPHNFALRGGPQY